MSTQQSNNESTGNAPTPAGGNNAKPKNEQDNGGGTNKPPNTKGKKNRNRKNKNKDKTNTTKVNEYVPTTVIDEFKNTPIDIHKPVQNFNKFVKTAASYADKKDQGLLAKRL